MAKEMIPLEETTFSGIKKSIDDYIKQNAYRYPIIDNYEGSVRTMLVDLLAGFMSYTQYKYMMYRNESFMDSAINKSSVMELSVNRYGYNFNRPVSPILEIKNISGEPLNMCAGDLVGYIPINNDRMDVVYMGDDMTVPPNGNFPVIIGRRNIMEGDFLNYNFNEPIDLIVKSDSYYIDNQYMRMYINDEEVRITRDQELHIIDNCVADVSVFYNIVRLKVFDESVKFGVEIQPTDTYKVIYIETPGRELNLPMIVAEDLNLDNKFHYVSIISYGEHEDSVEKIKELAPYYYTQFRVMSNELSHRVIANAYVGVLDVYVEKSPNECCMVDFYYLYEGSGKEPRVLNDFELDRYVEYLHRYKYMGMTLTKDNLIPANVKVVKFRVDVIYECSIVPEGYKIVEEIEKHTDRVLGSHTMKLGKTLSINEVVLDISSMTVNGRKAIKSVIIYENVGTDLDPQYEVLPLDKEYTCEKNQYIFSESYKEIYCT